MDEKTTIKVYENEILSNLNRRSLDPYELALLIDDYFKLSQAQGLKMRDICKKLGSTPRSLYKYRSMLKVPNEVIDKYKDKLSYEQISTITFSLKDKKKIEEVMQEAVDNQIGSKNLQVNIAEKNDKGKIVFHILNDILKMQGTIKQITLKIKGLPTEDQKRIREAIEDLINMLNKV